MEPSFEKLLALLADAGVQFVLVGGVAVTLHGYTRLTEDVDFPYASKAALMGLKQSSQREKDQLDVIALRRLSSGS